MKIDRSFRGALACVPLALALLAACSDQQPLSPSSSGTDRSALYDRAVAPALQEAAARPRFSTAALPAGVTELLVNGSFETGNFAGWSATISPNGATPLNPWSVGTGGQFGYMSQLTPQDGAYVATHGFDGSPMTFLLTQDVEIPASSSATLSWKYRIIWSTYGLPRTFTVEVRDPATNAILATVHSFATTSGSGDTGWRSISADLSAFAGQTVRLAFPSHIPQSFTGPAQFELDAVSLLTENLDDSPPAIVPTVTGTLGDGGWHRSDVSLSWSVSDGESAISSTDGCDAASVTDDTAGQSFTCSATSDGGSASETVVIKRDATAPEIAFSGNAGSYTVDQTVSITCSATDALSGLAVSDCPGVSADGYTFALGSHTLSASATDVAGNDAAASTTFTVGVSNASLCALVQRWVDKAGVAKSMCAQLGNGAIGAFQNHVRAQGGKSISAANAAILIALADGL